MCLVTKSSAREAFRVYPVTAGEPFKDFKHATSSQGGCGSAGRGEEEFKWEKAGGRKTLWGN